MLNRIASLLETTMVIGTLIASVVFSYGTIGASYFPAPAEQANVAEVSSSSAAREQAAEPKVLRINAAVDEDSPLRETPEEKTPKF